MKKKLLFIILSIVSLIANSQNCFWAKSAGGTYDENGQNIATDQDGNVYVIGDNSGSSITFDSITLAGSYNYLVKYNASGVIQWAKALNGQALGVIADHSDNVYIVGSYGGTKSFGSTILTCIGEVDVFIAKLDTDGNFIWAKSGGGTGSDDGRKIATDGINYIYVTGDFVSSSATFGSSSLTHDASVGPDFFIAKYDLSGNEIWAQSAGGNRADIGYGVTADAAGNSYVTGNFQSDSVKFGGITLYSLLPGAANTFVSKYDPTGNVIWAKSAGAVYGDAAAYDVKIDAAQNIYIAGEFSGISFTFGSDSLINHGSGASDVFIAKYDSTGNSVWARSGGGSDYDYSRSLTVDAFGNIYSIGYFMSPAIFFGSDTSLINSSGTASANTFITKYDNSGTLEWVKKVGNGTATDIAFGYGIASGPGDDVYFTGDFFSPSLAFSNTTLINAGSYDMFVADIYHFTSGIVSSTNVTCYGTNDGTAATILSGGHLPYTYSWTTSPIEITPEVTDLSAGNYSVTITEGYGCAQTSTVVISQPPADSAKICMVTVDSTSQYNIIIWDKTTFTSIDSFIVYREISTDNYQAIGSVPFDSLSEFVDTVRMRYFPNTGNPNAGSYRYKIEGKSACGGMEPISPYHNTIFIVNTGGIFSWPQLYTIEGGMNPVTSYVLMRDDSTSGNWHSVASVAGTQVLITDPEYLTYQSVASWKVQTQWDISCTPTRSVSASESNIVGVLTTGIDQSQMNNLFEVFPNPSNGIFTIKFRSNSFKNHKITVDAFDVLGEKIYSQTNEYSDQCVLDLSAKSKGIYFLKLKVNEQLFSRTITIQ